MQQTFYLSKYNGWKELPATLIYPINATYGIDGGTDSIEFSFYTKQDFDIPLDTPIKIIHNDDTRYFVVKDAKFSDMQYVNLTTQQKERLFTITLCEPLEILRGYRLQACKFSPNRYSVENCIRRMFMLANFRCNIDIPNPDNMITNVLEFASTTLYLAIYEVARTQDCIPYIEFDESTQGRWVLKFQHLDGLNEKIYSESIFKNPIIQKQNIGEGIAKKVYTESNNIKFQTFKLQQNYFAVAFDGSSKINIDNFGIKLNTEINDIKLIRIYADGQTWIFSNDTTINYVVLFEAVFYDQTRTIKILSKVNYDKLATSERENNNVIYIYYEDNIIYMNELRKLKPNTIDVPNDVWTDNWDAESATFAIQKIRGNANEKVGRIHDITKLLWQQNYQIYAKVTITKTIPFLAFNKSDYDDTTFYNQNAKAVDPISMERVLQSYIDDMQSGTLLRSGIFNNYNEIPQEGSIIVIDNKNYIVNSLTIVDNKSYYDVTFSLVEQHAKRREYLEANTNIQIEDITSNDLMTSLNLKPYIIKYSIIDEFNQIASIDFLSHEGVIFPKNDGKQFYNSKMVIDINSSKFLFLSNVDYIKYSNTISFYTTAETNFTWADALDNNGNLIPQTYVDSTGEIKDIRIVLVDDDINGLVEFTINGTNDYPIKDRLEIFTITNQYTYKGYGNTIVGKDFTEWNLNANSFLRVAVYIYEKQIGAYDLRPNNYVARSEAKVSVNTSTQTITLTLLEEIEGDYKSLVITDISGSQILMVKNYTNKQNSLNTTINIYYSIEDGLPLQTGVRPYNY